VAALVAAAAQARQVVLPRGRLRRPHLVNRRLARHAVVPTRPHRHRLQQGRRPAAGMRRDRVAQGVRAEGAAIRARLLAKDRRSRRSSILVRTSKAAWRR
jgi:hypothetical protein